MCEREQGRGRAQDFEAALPSGCYYSTILCPNVTRPVVIDFELDKIIGIVIIGVAARSELVVIIRGRDSTSSDNMRT